MLFKKYYFIFLFGGVGYPLLEIIWRGYTHPSMGIVGGICLVAIYFINERFCLRSKKFRAFLCTGIITTVELISGVFLNLYLGLNIWDYSFLPLNFLGQVCLPYAFLWYGLSYAIIYTAEKVKIFPQFKGF